MCSIIAQGFNIGLMPDDGRSAKETWRLDSIQIPNCLDVKTGKRRNRLVNPHDTDDWAIWEHIYRVVFKKKNQVLANFCVCERER